MMGVKKEKLWRKEATKNVLEEMENQKNNIRCARKENGNHFPLEECPSNIVDSN